MSNSIPGFGPHNAPTSGQLSPRCHARLRWPDLRHGMAATRKESNAISETAWGLTTPQPEEGASALLTNSVYSAEIRKESMIFARDCPWLDHSASGYASQSNGYSSQIRSRWLELLRVRALRYGSLTGPDRRAPAAPSRPCASARMADPFSQSASSPAAASSSDRVALIYYRLGAGWRNGVTRWSRFNLSENWHQWSFHQATDTARCPRHSFRRTDARAGIGIAYACRSVPRDSRPRALCSA